MHRAPSPEPSQKHSSRRGFFQFVAGALGMAFLARPATAVSLPTQRLITQVPFADLMPIESPGPDWERVPPSPPEGIGGWRNKKDGRFWTDWIPRQREKWVLNPKVLTDGTHQVTVRCFPPRWYAAVSPYSSAMALGT